MPLISPARVIIELLRSGQPVQFQARGSSMWPAIPSGSRVEVVPCAPAELEVGELAAFERAGEVVVHRVQGRSPAGIQFAGDSRAAADGCINTADVLGRARVIERRPLRVRVPSLWHLRWLWRAVPRTLSALRRRGARAAK
jgi:hypothetical protein